MMAESDKNEKATGGASDGQKKYSNQKKHTSPSNGNQGNCDSLSGYNGINPAPVRQLSWKDAIQEIRDGKYKEKIERLRQTLQKEGREAYTKAKCRLPAVSFGGIFSHRKNDGIEQPTGFIVCDLDHLPDVNQTFELLSQDENVWFVFRSPGGDGIKVGLRAEHIETDADHKSFYHAAERYFKKVYEINIDPACKDISRLTFLSSDFGAFINPNPAFFNIGAWTTESTPCKIQFTEGLNTSNGDGKQKYAKKVLETACRKIRESTPGSMHFTRLMMARLVGGFMHYGIDEAEAITALEQAVIKSGTNNFENAMKTIRAGLEHGKLSPIEIPENNITDSADITDRVENVKNADWEYPVLLDSFPLPEMEPLPGIIGEFCDAVAEATETPLELAQGLALSTVATAIQGKVKVLVKPGYTEPVNIWINNILDSANRKSSVLHPVTGPLLSWEAIQRQINGPKIRELGSRRENQEARIKSLRVKYGKAKSENLAEIEKEILKLERELVSIPVLAKVWVQDITPEHLGTVMKEQGGKMSIISAEGGIFDLMAGRYSGGIPNLDLFLQSHSGDPVRVDRGSRESIFIESPTLSIGLSTQPDVLRKIGNLPGFRGRGLLARFLYLLPVSPLGFRKLETSPVPHMVQDQWKQVIHKLLDLEPSSDDCGNLAPHLLKLSRQAYNEWLDFSRHVETELREGGRFEYIKDWAGKLPGATIRLAGLLHCVLFPQQPWKEQISLETMQQGLGLGAIFSEHALKVFDLMGCDKNIEGARKVWRWIERERFKSFRKNDCYNALKGTFPRVSDIAPCFEILSERNYIASTTEKRVGRPSVRFFVNPQLTKDW
jgi:hypothetical protein